MKPLGLCAAAALLLGLAACGQSPCQELADKSKACFKSACAGKSCSACLCINDPNAASCLAAKSGDQASSQDEARCSETLKTFDCGQASAGIKVACP